MPSARTKLKWSRTRLKGPEQHDSGIGDMFHSSYNLFFAGMSRSELPVQKQTGGSTGMKLTKVSEDFLIDAQAMQCRSVGERRFRNKRQRFTQVNHYCAELPQTSTSSWTLLYTLGSARKGLMPFGVDSPLSAKNCFQCTRQVPTWPWVYASLSKSF